MRVLPVRARRRRRLFAHLLGRSALRLGETPVFGRGRPKGFLAAMTTWAAVLRAGHRFDAWLVAQRLHETIGVDVPVGELERLDARSLAQLEAWTRALEPAARPVPRALLDRLPAGHWLHAWPRSSHARTTLLDIDERTHDVTHDPHVELARAALLVTDGSDPAALLVRHMGPELAREAVHRLAHDATLAAFEVDVASVLAALREREAQEREAVSTLVLWCLRRLPASADPIELRDETHHLGDLLERVLGSERLREAAGEAAMRLGRSSPAVTACATLLATRRASAFSA